MAPGDEITRLIFDWQRGDQSAGNALFEALYRKLHGIAQQCLRDEAPNHSLGPTALLHEAYLRLRRSEALDIANHAHFLALAAQVMRRILVDRARARHCEKRGDPVPLELDEIVARDWDAEQIIAVDQALVKLSSQSPRQAALVELRYFAGFSADESAAALGISLRTARREWQIARTRLRVAIDGPATTP